MIYFCSFRNMKVFLSICLLASLALAEEIVLKTNKGNVRGKRVDTDQGDYYYSFRGIRYAQAPVGKLRFMVSNRSKSDFNQFCF